ncbi:peroxiredoxin [Oculatella sp. LEGE 06141]|uniref:peroxiredoxin n=1 Tax=Oculatella sp. LEGE 06141 TaxID=1828648 RepID=UPI001882443F|nr:peroxiredoxin [Oculatella sp. LEGE 06141]MBE9179324.1 peroxiredoxin [Oculatella sp. LEGE 06141]
MSISNTPNPYELPPGLPVPKDDGACDHLLGTPAPDVTLQGTNGQSWNLNQITQTTAVVYVYPATGVPGQDPIPEWDLIPGAPGCTLQSLSFRDHYEEFASRNITVFGLSAQPIDEQKEFVQRTAIPFVLLSDPEFLLCKLLFLPTFESHGKTFYRRLALLFQEGCVSQYFYPIFPPNKSAEIVLAWLKKTT